METKKAALLNLIFNEEKIFFKLTLHLHVGFIIYLNVSKYNAQIARQDCGFRIDIVFAKGVFCFQKIKFYLCKLEFLLAIN
jgi:hypothetical protein